MTDLLPLSGILNGRDFGGYATASGRVVKKGTLYRTAHHANATEDDLAALSGLGLSAIVDLRRPSEKARQPSRRWEACTVPIIENDIEEEYLGWQDFLPGKDPTIDLFREHILEFYRRAPFMARFEDLFGRYFRTLADTDGPVLIHCVAGKDRTGLLAALTHSLAGVHRDDIVDDYLRTNALTGDRPDVHQTVAAYIAELCGSAPDDETVRYALGCQAEWLDASFRTIEQRHGAIDTYLEQALGVDAETRERLHARLLGD